MSSPAGDGGERETDYYAVLGIARDAEGEQIRRAHRSLAQVMHPDKLPSTASAGVREAAVSRFHDVQRAYEVLSDPSKRQVYDTFGEQGLRSGLEVGFKYKSLDELARDLERKRQRMADAALDAKVGYRGTYVFGLDAHTMLAPELPYDVARKVVLQSVVSSTTMTMPMGKDSTWYLGGQVGAKGRLVAAGGLQCGAKRVCSGGDLTLECSAVIGLRANAAWSATQKITEVDHGSVTWSWVNGGGIGLVLGWSRQLSERLTGILDWTVGLQGGPALGLKYAGEDVTCSADVMAGALSTGIQGTVSRTLGSGDSAVRANVKVATDGASCEVGATKRVGELTRLGLSLKLSNKGMWLNPSLMRGGQRFVFPVFLAPTLNPRILLPAAILPPLCYYASYRLVYLPYAKGEREATSGGRGRRRRQRRR